MPSTILYYYNFTLKIIFLRHIATNNIKHIFHSSFHEEPPPSIFTRFHRTPCINFHGKGKAKAVLRLCK